MRLDPAFKAKCRGNAWRSVWLPEPDIPTNSRLQIAECNAVADLNEAREWLNRMATGANCGVNAHNPFHRQSHNRFLAAGTTKAKWSDN